MNLAIIIGVEKYQPQTYDNLPACKKDAEAIKAVIENVKDLKELIFFGENETGSEIKRKISDIVEKYKGEDLNELFFYFSGHGERFEDDFFYVLSDFDPKRKETTGLRNSELDDWIKTLSPKLCIKIIDACFSGTQYIKSEFNAEEELKKSAKKYGLNDIYFWFSSRESESSYAGTDFSYFTESILTAITGLEGDVRYREIMAAVADDFADKGGPKPIFATQADNIEKFGTITKQTHQIIYRLFGLSEKNTETEEKKENLKPPKTHQQEENVYALAKRISDKTCFNEQTLIDFTNTFKEQIESWPQKLKQIYKVAVDSDVHPQEVPNVSKIGEWLKKQSEENYFAEVTYASKSYKTEEYKALPQKPKKQDPFGLSAAVVMGSLARWRQDEDTEYKLETVTKSTTYVNGFSYTHNAEHRILKVTLEPNIEIASPICMHTISIYSNKAFSIHFSYETLKRKNWEQHSKPECNKWKTLKVNINAENSASLTADLIKKEIMQWLEIELKKITEQ